MSQKNLWSLNKAQYLFVKKLAQQVVITERTFSLQRLNKKLVRLREGEGSAKQAVKRIHDQNFDQIYNKLAEDMKRDLTHPNPVTHIDVDLCDAELRVLNRGPSFVPSTGKVTTSDIINAEKGVERAMFGFRWRLLMNTDTETRELTEYSQVDNARNDNNTPCITEKTPLWSDDPKLIKLRKIRTTSES